MSREPNLIAIPTAAMHALVDTEVGDADIAVYLPTASRNGPVLYRETGVGLSKPDIERLRTRGVSSLFVRGPTQQACETALETKLADILVTPDISSEQKAACVFFAGSATVRNLIDMPDAQGSLYRAWQLLDVVIESVLADPVLAPALLQAAGQQRSTANHMFAVSMLSMLLGMEALGSDSHTLKELGLAGLLHDLGKTGIAPTVLNKSGPLDAEEMGLLMQHPIESVRLINADPQANSPVRQMILQHHERVDGAGYPLGLAGNEILPGSRILAIVDAFHAMVGRPSYTGPVSPTKAVKVLASQAGRQLDAEFLGCWQGLFERYWREQAIDPAADQAENERAVSQDHRSPKQPQGTSRRPPRFACDGTVKVGCVYAGRLRDVSAAADTFVAPLSDVSKAGLCIRTDHPMYRGEVVNVLMDVRRKKVWVRAVIAWCRKQPTDSTYRTGLRLIQRISPDEARQRSEPKASTVPVTSFSLPPSPMLDVEDATGSLIATSGSPQELV